MADTQTLEQIARERTVDDAPLDYSHDQALGWATGYNEAVTALTAVQQQAETERDEARRSQAQLLQEATNVRVAARDASARAEKAEAEAKGLREDAICLKAERDGWKSRHDLVAAVCRTLRARYEAAEARERELRAALEELIINANRLTDRNLGGTYEEDARRSVVKARALLTSQAGELPQPHPVPRAYQFDCAECGTGIAVDEDGCCRSCGTAATPVAGGESPGPQPVASKPLCPDCGGSGTEPDEPPYDGAPFVAMTPCATCAGYGTVQAAPPHKADTPGETP